MAEAAVILNARAGTIHDLQPEEVRRMLERAVAESGHTARVELVEGGDFFKAIDAAAKGSAPVVVVGGGDGSVSHAVRKLAGTGKTLGVLPLGTMNLFARGLGMPLALTEALAALGRSHPREVDLASVNGRIFHTLAGLGFFSEVARAREEMRGGSLPFSRFFAVAHSSLKAFVKTGQLLLDIETEAERRSVEAYALLVTNNRFEGLGWQRPQLDAGVLELHVAEGPEIAQRVQAAFDLVAGRWRDNPGIHSAVVRRAVVTARRPKLWLSIDGELVRATSPLVFESRPRALSVLMPEPLSAG